MGYHMFGPSTSWVSFAEQMENWRTRKDQVASAGHYIHGAIATFAGVVDRRRLLELCDGLRDPAVADFAPP